MTGADHDKLRVIHAIYGNARNVTKSITRTSMHTGHTTIPRRDMHEQDERTSRIMDTSIIAA